MLAIVWGVSVTKIQEVALLMLFSNGLLYWPDILTALF
jgi:hypothetical protein